jgi:abhydrolase domain-containing protein 14
MASTRTGPTRRRVLAAGSALIAGAVGGLVATSCGDDPAAGSSDVRIAGSTVHLIDRAPRGRADGVVLFLHGGSYTSADWDRLGLLDDVVGAGWRTVAIDLPGAGGSDPTNLSPPDFLGAVVDHLGADPVIVSPSASGTYSLPFVAAHADRVRGYVPVAPVGAAAFRLSEGVDPPPTLVVWGSDDALFSPSIAPRLAEQLHGRAEIIRGAGHSAYEDDTPRFWHLLSGFLAGLSR